jgi:hypothetical protein
MAPGIAGNVYALDLRFEGRKLIGDVDEVQPSPGADEDFLNLRWDNALPAARVAYSRRKSSLKMPHGTRVGYKFSVRGWPPMTTSLGVYKLANDS